MCFLDYIWVGFGFVIMAAAIISMWFLSKMNGLFDAYDQDRFGVGYWVTTILVFCFGGALVLHGIL